MGNCFRRFFGEDSHSEYGGYGYGREEAGGAGPIVYTDVGFTAVARDLFEFETTNKVCFSLLYDFRNACEILPLLLEWLVDDRCGEFVCVAGARIVGILCFSIQGYAEDLVSLKQCTISS